MAKCIFTQKAIDDLSDIWTYTLENWSEKQADKYYQLLIDGCSELSKTPDFGNQYFEIHPELFGKLTSKHIIFYRKIDQSTIEVVRILHERMDYKNTLKR
jgi:toxin ParE1/3/4